VCPDLENVFRKLRVPTLENIGQTQWRSDGGIWGNIPPSKKSVQVNFSWGRNDLRTAIEHEYSSYTSPENLYTPPKQISGYAPG